MSSLSPKKSPSRHWRSLAELEGRPEYREFVEREFAQPLEELPPSSPERRRFMQIAGASLALAGVTGCRWNEEKILPYTRRPVGLVPGETRNFATSMELGGVGVGLLVASYDNRPIKVEGHPAHPSSRGAASLLHQAGLLEVYDPDRSTAPQKSQGGARTQATWDDVTAYLAERATAAKADGGARLRVLAEPSSSPTRARLKAQLLAAYPQMKWVDYTPIDDDNERIGASLAFGRPLRTHYAFERASVVLSLDSDFVFRHPNALAWSRDLIAGRDPDRAMNRLYAIESTFTHLGALADHRLPLRSELIKAVAAYLDAELSQKLGGAALGAAQPKPSAAFLNDPKVQKFLAALLKDLQAAGGKSVIVAGEQQPPEVHALAHRLNALLGAVGVTVDYSEDLDPERARSRENIKTLTDALKSKSVETLLILGGNPVYDAPADLDFGAALTGVPHSIHLALYDDETSKRCTLHVPAAHWLESWGDSRAWDGTLTLQQPLIAPLYEGKSVIELVAALASEPKRGGLELVRKTHQDKLGDERRWRKAVHDGHVSGTAFERIKPTPKALEALPLGELAADPQNGALELVLMPDPKLHDGRFANNAWLIELPDSFTKVSWDNVACIAPATAQRLGVTDSTLVKLTVDGRDLTLPAVISPGQAEGSVLVQLGWGRTESGVVAGRSADRIPASGQSAYKLRTQKLYDFGAGLTVTPTGEQYLLAGVQDRFVMDQMGVKGIDERMGQLLREAPLAEYKKTPDFAQHRVHHPPLLNLWAGPVSYDGHKWGMSVDLNKCTGCSACIVACQAENNIPVVGKASVERGREMYWLRIDRYYRGTVEAPEVSFQPVTCHHCESAPCEQVCPVGATMHSHEGLNDMVYNRCIGTRYCSNNCPYKVRKFNYFNFREDLKDAHNDPRKMVYNPEVTVRSRGVMEKCSFCVQRIQKVKIKAKNARRPVKADEIVTACQQTCPTGAIVFGNLNDGEAEVRHQHYHPRSYAMLGELNNRPRLQYLARVRNPNPELV
jgi:MoCo/4Fe-4S cofactor protein with predicted Tat translocation signal